MFIRNPVLINLHIITLHYTGQQHKMYHKHAKLINDVIAKLNALVLLSYDNFDGAVRTEYLH